MAHPHRLGQRRLLARPVRRQRGRVRRLTIRAGAGVAGAWILAAAKAVIPAAAPTSATGRVEGERCYAADVSVSGLQNPAAAAG